MNTDSQLSYKPSSCLNPISTQMRWFYWQTWWCNPCLNRQACRHNVWLRKINTFLAKNLMSILSMQIILTTRRNGTVASLLVSDILTTVSEQGYERPKIAGQLPIASKRSEGDSVLRVMAVGTSAITQRNSTRFFMTLRCTNPPFVSLDFVGPRAAFNQ